MTKFMARFTALLLACWPELSLADPLDAGEAYVSRGGPPEWMDKTDFGLLLVDYGVFALAIVALGWMIFKRPQYLFRLESLVRYPFHMVFLAAKRSGGVIELILQSLGGLAAVAAMVGWIFFCQWLKHQGLGALSMIGLAFAAFILVRVIKGNEVSQPV